MNVWIITLLILSTLVEIFNVRILQNYHVYRENNKFLHYIQSILHIIWVVYAGYFGTPDPIFFAGIYLLQFIFLRLSTKGIVKISNYLVMVNLLFCSYYLIIFGFFNIYLETTLSPENSFPLQLFSLIGSKALMLVSCFLPWSKIIYQHRAQSEDNRRETLFRNILFFFLLYVFVDCCLCLYDTTGIFVPLMLLTGNLLLLLLHWLFLRQEYLMAESQYLEEERRRMETQTALEQYKAKVREQMIEKDSLTGAYSRRYAIQKITEMNQLKMIFSVVYIDLDGLKKINDKFGHNAGDEYLKNFVAILEKHLNSEDIIARVGGDEFLVLLPGKEKEVSLKQMEQIRFKLSTPKVKTESIHFSFGISSGGTDINDMIKQADQEMYLDKQRTREDSLC